MAEFQVTESQEFKQLKEQMQEMALLGKAGGLLVWDQQVYMPPGGGAIRGQVLALLQRMTHERLTSPEIGRLLDKLDPMVRDLDPDSDAAVLVRLVRREFEQAVKLPTELVVAAAEARAVAYPAWVKAREAKDFSLFQDPLTRMFDLAQQVAEALGYEDHPYDALLDRFEENLKTADVQKLFGGLRDRLVPLVRKIGERAGVIDDKMLHQSYPQEQQLALAEEALRLIGFDFERGRQDLTVHPFCMGLSPNDVRLTTRVDPNWFNNCFYSAMHEGGHGLYEQGLPVEYEGLPLGSTISLGIHESQSRLWENVIGRSLGFWEYFLPVARKHFPTQLDGVTPEQMYRAVNKSEPSFIRTEADEVTYNLHIMLRFDIEQDLLAGKLAVKDLPEQWNAKMEEYLGITPPNPALGVLQDVHWSSGLIGYFPTYTLGTIAANQLYDAAVAANPDIPAGIARGDLSGILAFMRENVHKHGSRYTPQELLKRATGSELTVEPYMAYMEKKYTEIYGL